MLLTLAALALVILLTMLVWVITCEILGWPAQNKVEFYVILRIFFNGDRWAESGDRCLKYAFQSSCI